MTASPQIDLLLEEVLALPRNAERPAFLARPDLAGLLEMLVVRLAARTEQLSRTDPPRALEVAEIALEAAERAGSHDAAGYANRARANALRFVGQFEEALPYY